MKRLLRIGAALALAFSTAAPATATGWSVLTNVRQVRRLLADSGNVYAATSGGLYRRGEPGGAARVFNSGDGIGSNDLRALARDGNVFWMGGDGGVLCRFDQASWEVKNHPLGLDGGRIEALALGTDTVWVGTDVGVGLFLPRLAGGVLKEIYTRLGPLPAEASVVDLILFGDRLFVATRFGIVSADRKDPTLHIPSRWTGFADPDGALRSARAFAIFRDSLFVASDSGLFVLADTLFTARFRQRRVLSLFAGSDTLWLGTDAGAYYRTADSVAAVASLNLRNRRLEAIAQVPGGHLWVSVAGGDLHHYGSSGPWFIQATLDQPAGSVVAGVAVADGKVWCAHLGSPADYLTAAGSWKTIAGISASFGSPLKSVVAFGDRVFYPGWGQGLYVLRPAGDTVVLTHYHTGNSLLEPAEGDATLTYTVVADVEVDASGGLWVANRKTRAPTRRSLIYMPPGGGTAVAYDSTDTPWGNDPQVTLLVGGRLWIGFNGSGLGVLEVGKPDSKTDDQRHTFTTMHRLPSDVITTLAADAGGKIWAGTPAGLVRIDPGFFPFLVVDFAVLDPADSEVLALAADGTNAMWVGTGRGLARIPNGALVADSVWFAGSSPLPHNRVNGLAVDSLRALLWMATDNGLASRPLLRAAGASELAVYPNPLRLRYDGDRATFDVPFGARIDLFTLAGDRVRSLVVGNRWDGRNEAGQLVASGLYLFRVTYADGSTARGRLGVIRDR